VVRRFAPTLFLVALGACAHDSNPPATPAPSASHAAHGTTSSAASLPSAQPAPLAPEDAALSAHFQAAPAISTLEGQASYYSDRLAGHKTASGERYRPDALTAAHRSLPLGTVLRVTRSDGKRTVYVRVNDRGPFGSERRILDLSRAAFERLGKLRAGVLEVRAEVVEYGKKHGH
jgi:rare lipoprotein A